MRRLASMFRWLAVLVFCLSLRPLPAVLAGKVEGVVVTRQIEPRYPGWAYNNGVSKGFAKIAFYVDERGEISELMPIEYSHAVFAEELMTALVKWDFRPAYEDGRPIKSVCHAYWEFLPDRPIETNVFFDVAKRMEGDERGEYRELKYREERELDDRIGMVAFPGLILQVGDPGAEAGLESMRARVSFFVDQTGGVALPQVLDASHPELSEKLESALWGATFQVPSFEGNATLALLERTYDFPVVWTEEAVAETL